MKPKSKGKRNSFRGPKPRPRGTPRPPRLQNIAVQDRTNRAVCYWFCFVCGARIYGEACPNCKP